MNSLSVKLILQAVDRMTSPIRSMTNRLSGFFRQINQAIASVGKKTMELGRTLESVGGGLTARLTTSIGGLGWASLKAAGEVETLGIKFESLLQSKSAADEMVKTLNKFAAGTPFEMKGISNAAIYMLTAGIETDKLIDRMTVLGDVASLAGEDIGEIAKYYSRVRSSGTAYTIDLEMFSDRGVPIWQSLEKVTGKSVKVLRKAAGDGKISFDLFEKALENLRNEGGAAFEQMGKQGLSFFGLISTLSDTVYNSFAKIGSSAIKNLDIKKLIEEVTLVVEKLASAFEALNPQTQKWIFYSALALSVVGPFILALGQLVLGFGALFKGIALTGSAIAWFYGTILFRLIPALWAASAAVVNLGIAFMATPLGWITAGITALAVAGYLIITNWEAVKKFWTDLWDGMKKTVSDAVDYLRPLIDWVSSALNTVVDAGVQVGNFVTDNAVTRGVGDFFGYSGQTTQSGSTVPVTSPLLTQNLNAGGTIDIKINSEARPSVVRVKPADNRMNYNVDTGLIMGGAW